MPAKPKAYKSKATRFYFRVRILGLGFFALALAACLPVGSVTRDFSAFQTYQFRQTPALGFCVNTKQVYSAEIAQKADGAMIFSHSSLVVAGQNPEQCDDGFPAEEGCMKPKDQPTRTLNQEERDRVNSVFSSVSYYKKPDPICRELAIDPCRIETHSWDSKGLSDYFCGGNRISEEQGAIMQKLLADLQAGG